MVRQWSDSPTADSPTAIRQASDSSDSSPTGPTGPTAKAQVAASEARTVHVRPGRLPSTETGLALCTDRPRAEDPGRSGRPELSGSGPAPGGQERDRLEFQLSLSLHDGSWPSVGPTGPSKDPESRGAMGWKQLLPSHGTASDSRYGSADHSTPEQRISTPTAGKRGPACTPLNQNHVP